MHLIESRHDLSQQIRQPPDNDMSVLRHHVKRGVEKRQIDEFTNGKRHDGLFQFPYLTIEFTRRDARVLCLTVLQRHDVNMTVLRDETLIPRKTWTLLIRQMPRIPWRISLLFKGQRGRVGRQYHPLPFRLLDL